MRFLVDECTDPKVAAWLRAEGHEVFSVFDEARGVEDDQVIQKGNRNGRPRKCFQPRRGDLIQPSSQSKLTHPLRVFRKNIKTFAKNLLTSHTFYNSFRAAL